MKKIILLFVLFLAPKAWGYDPNPTQSVSQTSQSTWTCVGVNIASAPATTQVVTNGGVLSSTGTLWRSITVQNRDTTANVFCDDNPQVSSGTVFSVQTGFELAPGSPGDAGVFHTVPGMPFYCTNDSGTKSAASTVCLSR